MRLESKVVTLSGSVNAIRSNGCGSGAIHAFPVGICCDIST